MFTATLLLALITMVVCVGGTTTCGGNCPGGVTPAPAAIPRVTSRAAAGAESFLDGSSPPASASWRLSPGGMPMQST